MKLFKSLFVLFVFFLSLQSYTQNNCGTSLPFCATTSYSFPAGVNNGSAAAGPNYGCLLTQPNPAWYYVQIAQTGPVTLLCTGSAGGDVDVICWGPFTSATGNCGNLTAGNTVSCDYSSSATGTITIPNAQVGQFYQVLITNFSNQVQNINFGQSNSGSAGAGSTNCNFTSSASSQSICPTRTATLVATTSLFSPTYVWTPGGQTTSSITVSPAATTVYSVSITGQTSASGPSTQTTVVNMSTVTILPTPTVSIVSNSDVCPSSPIFLNATSGFTNYVWTTPVGTQTTIVNSLSIPNATTNLMGTYTVSVNSAQGCPGTGTTTVNMINTSPVNALVPASACEGGTVALTAIAVGAVSYSWSGPGGYVSSLQNPLLSNVTISQGGIYTVTASFTGAGTNTCTTVTTTTVTVIPASTVALTPLSTVCSLGTINLSAPGGGNTYNWTGPGGFTSNVQNPVINNAEVLKQGIYSVSITASGCVRTGSINVNVYDVLSYTTVPPDTTLCYGETVTLASAGAGGSGNYNYSWSPANDLSDPGAAITIATGVTMPSMQYTITLSDANCPITQPISTLVTINVDPTPVITLGKDMRGCEPFLAPIESSSVPTSTNCAWLFSNSSAYSQCGTTNGFMFPLHGSYDATLSVVDINGCTNTITANDYVTVDPLPIADFSYLPLNPTVLINEVTFNDNSTIGVPMDSLEWNFGDFFQSPENNASGVSNPSHVYDNAATYTVSLIVTNKFGCKDTVTKYVNVEEEFALFVPNAFTPGKNDGKNDVFFPQGIGFDPDSFTMGIYDRWGNEIYKTNDITKGWDGSIKGGKPVQGVYVYKILVTDFKKHDRVFTGHITLL
jgi:gliding motility-associated-like protein